jgi:hypothetical protein
MNKITMVEKVENFCKVGYARTATAGVIINQSDLWDLADVLKEIIERLPILHPETRPHNHNGTIHPDCEYIPDRRRPKTDDPDCQYIPDRRKPHTHILEVCTGQISCRTCYHRSPLDGPCPSKDICIDCRRLKNHEEGDRR